MGCVLCLVAPFLSRLYERLSGPSAIASYFHQSSRSKTLHKAPSPRPTQATMLSSSENNTRGSSSTGTVQPGMKSWSSACTTILTDSSLVPGRHDCQVPRNSNADDSDKTERETGLHEAACGNPSIKSHLSVAMEDLNNRPPLPSYNDMIQQVEGDGSLFYPWCGTETPPPPYKEVPQAHCEDIT